jgi:hypothetical protein
VCHIKLQSLQTHVQRARQSCAHCTQEDSRHLFDRGLPILHTLLRQFPPLRRHTAAVKGMWLTRTPACITQTPLSKQVMPALLHGQSSRGYRCLQLFPTRDALLWAVLCQKRPGGSADRAHSRQAALTVPATRQGHSQQLVIAEAAAASESRQQEVASPCELVTPSCRRSYGVREASTAQHAAYMFGRQSPLPLHAPTPAHTHSGPAPRRIA